MNLPSVKQFGLIAQEVEQVLPSIVSENVQPGNSGVNSEKAEAIHFKGLNYTQLIPVLISAMQEQQKEIEALKTEIKTLKK
jgi:AmiR/NasT family two-component response regulator